MAVDTNLVPYRDPVIDESMIMTSSWQSFFRTIQDIVFYLQPETYFTLTNNLAVAANIESLVFDKRFTSSAVIDYVIQRTSSSAELIQSGILMAVYKPRADAWSVFEYGTPGPHASGVTFTITSAGQVQYTTTNQAGTIALSRMIFRARPFHGKSQTYSVVG